MESSEQPAPAAAAAAEAGAPPPRDERRDRTSELELLITGGVLFALFQLVRVSDEAFLRLFLNLGGTLLQAAVVGYEYTKLILYTLIVTFVAHLALRAWWVGLVGIDSAFPAGPRWERLRHGPVATEVYRELPPVRRLLVLADVLASVVFATGIAVAALFAFSVVLIVVFGAAAWALHLAVPALSLQRAFLVVAAPLVALTLVAALVDRLWGKQLVARGRERWLRRAMRLSSRITGGAGYLPITLVLTSNLPKRRVYAGLGLGIALVLSVFIGRDLLFGLGFLSFDSHRFLPARPAAEGFDPHYYESYRDPVGDDWRLPSIPAEVVTGPYLRLFVPLLPERVDEGVRALCPQLRPAREPGLHPLRRRGEAVAGTPEAPLRDCLLRMTRITLDGKPVPPAQVLLGVHPISSARGLLAQLPVAQLAAGEHRLVDRGAATPRLEAQAPPPRDPLLALGRGDGCGSEAAGPAAAAMPPPSLVGYLLRWAINAFWRSRGDDSP